MNKRVFSTLIILPLLLLLLRIEANSQGTPMPVPNYQYWSGSYNYIYGYFFQAPRDFWIVGAQVLIGPASGNQSIEIYRMTQFPSYAGQFFWEQYFYPYTPGLVPLWSVRNNSTSGEILINQGTGYPSGTIQDIMCTTGNTYYVVGNRANYYSSMGYGYGYNSNIGGTPVTLWAGYVYNGYQMYNNWCYYGWMYPYYSYYVGRTQIYYMLPCYIYVTQTAGGTIAPGTTYGPFKPGTDVNRNYTVTPNSGKHIVDVTINGTTVGSITRPVHTQHFGVVNVSQTLSAVYGNRIIATGYGSFINPTGTTYYVTGSNPSFVCTPFPGATISYITAVGTVSGTVNIPVLNSGQGQTIALGQPGYPFASLNEDWTLDVVCVMNLFTSVEAHGTINPLGSNDIIYGTQYPVQIIPDPNYKVKNLFVDGYDVMDPTSPGYPRPELNLSAWPLVTYTINMIYSHTIHATFYAYTLTPEVVGTGGTIIPGETVKVFEHAQYPFNFIPSDNYHIAYIGVTNVQTGITQVQGNLPPHGDHNILLTNIMADYKVSASFTIDNYIVTVKNAKTMEGGKVFPTGTLSNESNDGILVVNSGSSLNFTITPDLGWQIQDVLLDGASQGQVNSFSLNTIKADHELDATFQRISFSIQASAGNHGTITLDGWTDPVPENGSYPVLYGDNARFIITPDHGYKINDVKVDGRFVNPETEYNFYYVTANHSITSSFAPMNKYTITASAGTGGTITPSGAVSVFEGDDQPFSWTPNSGYEVADVLIDGVSAGKITDYTFGNVTSDHTIEIIFNPIITYGIQCEMVSMQLVSAQPFDITVNLVNQATQQPVNPPAPLNVTISKGAGATGTLSGTLQGTIPTNDNKVTISGIVYTNNSGEANVQFIASATGLQDCMLTANLLASEPTMQDGGIRFDNVSSYNGGKDGTTALSKVTITWTPGDGNKRLVLMKAANPISNSELPVDGTGYQANSAFGSGDAIGNAYVVFDDAGNTFTANNLIEGTLYYVRVFGFNGSSALSNYNTSTGTDNPSSFLVQGTEDLYYASGFSVTNITPNPAFLDIKFNLNVGMASPFTIEVVDLQGRVVSSFCNKKFYENGNYPVTLPLANLVSGSYVLKIYNGTDFAYQVFTVVR